jgi:hypothetical protein
MRTALKAGLGVFMCAALCSVAAVAEERGDDTGMRDAPKPPALGPVDPHAWSPIGNEFTGSKDISRYYNRVLEKANETARTLTAQREAVEQAANAAAEAASARADDERRKIAAIGSDPDDSPEVVAQRRKALSAALDAKVADQAAEARRKIIDDARASHTYVDAAKIEADLQSTRDALNAELKTIYSEAITRAVDKLNADYETAGSQRRVYAENESGYKGPYYKLERVERYFGENWKGGKLLPNVEKCTLALGFKKDGDSADFKDPTVDNVDKLCGVRDGLVALLASYKGRNKASVFEAGTKP